MTQTERSATDVVDAHADAGLYGATVGACLASTLMLFAPGQHADGFMALAWGCMGVSAVCLVVKLGVAMVSRVGVDSAGPMDV